MILQKPRVAHFARKNTQFKASFIRNQIASHINFSPVLVWRSNISKLYDGGFATFDFSKFPSLDLEKDQNLPETVFYKGPKILSNRQIDRVLQFLKVHRVRICHFHFGTDCGVFYPLLKRLDIPSVVSFYGYDSSSFPKFLFRYGKVYLKNRVFKDISAVLAMSPDMKMDLLKAGCPEEKVLVHYYGTDTKRFAMDQAYRKKINVNLLILAGLDPQKGHLFLLQSLLNLKEAGISNWELRIVGVGELETPLKDFVKENGLSDHVVFVGAVGYASEEMMSQYCQADVFVHPSVIAANGDKEGIPGTVIEAMSAGLPVISTFHAGIPYVIEDGRTGLLVKEWDIAALEKAITRLIEDPELRMRLGRAGQSSALESLDLHEKEKELEEIYDHLMPIQIKTPQTKPVLSV